MADIFVIGWVYLPAIFLILHNIKGFWNDVPFACQLYIMVVKLDLSGGQGLEDTEG